MTGSTEYIKDTRKAIELLRKETRKTDLHRKEQRETGTANTRKEKKWDKTKPKAKQKRRNNRNK
jgi:hypothetical protein